MDQERITQALIRALVTAVAAGVGILIPWLATPEAQDALGTWAIWTPLIIGLLGGMLKFAGGVTSAPPAAAKALGRPHRRSDRTRWPSDWTVRGRDLRLCAATKPPV